MTAALKIPIRREECGGDAVCDINILLPAPFALQSGETLSRPELSLRVHGDISRPAICVAGGVSAGRAAADHAGVRGWWRDIVRVGGAVDLSRYCIIGFDFLPNAAETARTISTRDQARALVYALETLNIRRLKAFVGASYGGMAALAFAEEFPDRLERLCVVSASDRAHPAATALRGIQRRIIGFALKHGAAEEGVSLARQLAMTSYRTAEEFALRFSGPPAKTAGDPYDVCRYLVARGDACAIAPDRYVTLADSLDRHRIDAAKITTLSLFLAASSDRLVPAEDTRRLARAVGNGTFAAFPSLYGHDAFLKEAPTIGPMIKSFIEDARS